MKTLTKKEIDFLRESNAIEGEYSSEALTDSMTAWEYAKKKDISIKAILYIHRILMRHLNPRIAGKIRDVDVWVGGRKGYNPKIIKDELNILCEKSNNLRLVTGNSLSTEKRERDYKELWIKNWHIEFEKIHPFEDGNGRTGRILMNLQRLKLGLPLLIIHEGKEQIGYYRWFK